MTKYFIEDAITLTPKNLLNGNVYNKKSGIDTANMFPFINYWMETEEDPSVWMISVNNKEPQRVAIEWETITYGERAYFRCSCDHRASKLYLPPNGNEFKCKNCHKMVYQLTTFNRNSVAGKTLYKMNRMHKLAEKRASMGRVLYKGIYTKKFERFLGLCNKAGYTSIVKGAEQLRELINA